MFDALLNRYREWSALRDWQGSPLGQSLAIHTNEYFSKYPRLSDLSEESKSKIIGDFYQSILAISQTDNPFLAMREKLAAYVSGFSALQVLCLTEEEKQVGFYADCPYISGELCRHIDKTVEHVEQLRELKWKHPDISNSELISFCNSRCVVYLYYLNGFNLVRGEFDDIDSDKDWLQPFVKSMLIWEEDLLRGKIGMKSLLPGDLDGLKHSTFFNAVVNGHKNPFFVWETGWTEKST